MWIRTSKAAASLGCNLRAMGWLRVAASSTSHWDWTQLVSRDTTSKVKRLGKRSPTSSELRACQIVQAATLATWIRPSVSSTRTALPAAGRLLLVWFWAGTVFTLGTGYCDYE